MILFGIHLSVSRKRNLLSSDHWIIQVPSTFYQTQCSSCDKYNSVQDIFITLPTVPSYMQILVNSSVHYAKCLCRIHLSFRKLFVKKGRHITQVEQGAILTCWRHILCQSADNRADDRQVLYIVGHSNIIHASIIRHWSPTDIFDEPLWWT